MNQTEAAEIVAHSLKEGEPVTSVGILRPIEDGPTVLLVHVSEFDLRLSVTVEILAQP